MQSLPLFIVESQAAKRRLLRIFELQGDCESHPKRNGVAYACEDQPASGNHKLDQERALTPVACGKEIGQLF